MKLTERYRKKLCQRQNLRAFDFLVALLLLYRIAAQDATDLGKKPNIYSRFLFSDHVFSVAKRLRLYYNNSSFEGRVLPFRGDVSRRQKQA